MSKVRCSRLILAVSVSCQSWVSPATAQIASMSAGTPEQQAIYLSGAAAAFAVLNVQVPSGERRYCPPADYVLTAQEMQRLASIHLIGPTSPSPSSSAHTMPYASNFPAPDALAVELVEKREIVAAVPEPKHTGPKFVAVLQSRPEPTVASRAQ